MLHGSQKIFPSASWNLYDKAKQEVDNDLILKKLEGFACTLH
jgi:hypothetical protein